MIKKKKTTTTHKPQPYVISKECISNPKLSLPSEKKNGKTTHGH